MFYVMHSSASSTPPRPFPPIVFIFCRICYTDTIGVQEDQYPPNIAVKVNQSYCHVPVSNRHYGSHILTFMCVPRLSSKRNKSSKVSDPLKQDFSFQAYVRGDWLLTRLAHFTCVQGYYPSNKPGVEPRRPCRPVNITPWLHLSTASNRVTVTWGNFGKVSRLTLCRC